MEAVVLAGGMGTRLRSVVSDLPKPMAPVAGKPFLEYILTWLSSNGVERAVLSVGYKWECIRDHFGLRFGDMEIDYSVEDHPLGTGGAVALAISHTHEQTILVVNGDTSFPIALDELVARHSKTCGATLALKRMENFDRYGTVVLEGDSITAFQEKAPQKSGLINAGIYALDRNFLSGRGLADRFSLEQDVLEKEAGQGRLFGAVFDAPFLDIGIPEDYARAPEFLC